MAKIRCGGGETSRKRRLVCNGVGREALRRGGAAAGSGREDSGVHERLEGSIPRGDRCLPAPAHLMRRIDLRGVSAQVELLQGEFDNRMYSIDMNSKLQLTALMIPRPGRSPVPLVRPPPPDAIRCFWYFRSPQRRRTCESPGTAGESPHP